MVQHVRVVQYILVVKSLNESVLLLIMSCFKNFLLLTAPKC